MKKNQIGIEYSSALANIAAWKNMNKDNETDVNTSLVQIVQGDCLKVPLRSNFADAVISIAVFHHLVTEVNQIIILNTTILL